LVDYIANVMFSVGEAVIHCSVRLRSW